MTASVMPVRPSQPAASPDSPRYERPEVVAAKETLTLVNDLMQGPERMWKRRSAYIRQWRHEEQDVYDVRSLGEPCHGGLKRTIVAAVGMLWGREPAITWNAREDVMRPLWDNIDAAGTKGHVLGARLTRAAIREGFALVLVDHPPLPRDETGAERTPTAADDARLNRRPFWAFYARSAVLNWRAETINNLTVLTSLTLHEPGTTNEGRYGVRAVDRFRRVFLNAAGEAAWEVWLEVVGDDGEVRYELEAEGRFTNAAGETRSSLPVAVAYAGVKEAPLVCDVPLEGVAYANLAHWQLATDLTFNRRVAGFEQLVVSGELKRDPNTPDVEGSVRVGPLVVLHVEQGGSVTWASPSGSGIEQLRQAVDEKERQMDQLGLGFLLPRKTVRTTATEARLDSYAQLATLATTGQAIEDAINEAWELTGWYLGIDKTDVPVIDVNTEFDEARMDSATMQAYIKLTEVGFPKMAVLQALQEGGRLPPDVDLEELAMEWDAESEARREQAVMMREAMQRAAGAQPPDGDEADATEEDDQTDDNDEGGSDA